MRIIVDTNIIFSLLLNPNTNIGNIFFKSNGLFEFYSSTYLKWEIQKHWNKVIKISKITEAKLQLSYDLVVNEIIFIDEETISKEIWLSSEKIADKIDRHDVAFIALTTFLEGTLWTGDKALYNGLRKIEFKSVVNSNELSEIKKSK